MIACDLLLPSDSQSQSEDRHRKVCNALHRTFPKEMKRMLVCKMALPKGKQSAKDWFLASVFDSYRSIRKFPILGNLGEGEEKIHTSPRRITNVKRICAKVATHSRNYVDQTGIRFVAALQFPKY